VRPTSPPIALTIAGSDSGGGAGIQADLKTFHARGVHGLSAITAITSQNTREVAAVHAIPQAHIRSQIAALFDDFPVAAVKTGMLGSAAITHLIARNMAARKPAWLVVDPVMIASSGARLLDEPAIDVLLGELVPLADILTPNLPEAETLLGCRIRTPAQCDKAGAALLALGAGGVLLKGGHTNGGEVVDRYYDARGVMALHHPRLPLEAHGTGCTLAAAITAELARGRTPRSAVRRAVAYVHRSLQRAYRPGSTDVHVLQH
jgi:hydroxymethylpyrimidine/phosphomethylpyrimidine kinase